MKKIIILVSSIFSAAFASAQEVSEIPISLPQPLMDSIQSLASRLSILVGGLFGLYVILILVRAYYERKKVRLLEDIRKDVDLLTLHFGVKHSHPKKSIFRRLLGIFDAGEKDSSKKPKK